MYGYHGLNIKIAQLRLNYLYPSSWTNFRKHEKLNIYETNDLESLPNLFLYVYAKNIDF